LLLLIAVHRSGLVLVLLLLLLVLLIALLLVSWVGLLLLLSILRLLGRSHHLMVYMASSNLLDTLATVRDSADSLGHTHLGIKDLFDLSIQRDAN
jgi:hypothetical protein